MDPIVAEIAVSGLAVTTLAPYALAAYAMKRGWRVNTAPEKQPQQTSVGAAADVAPATPTGQPPAAAAPLAAVKPQADPEPVAPLSAVQPPTEKARRGPNPKLSEFASQRPRKGGRFVPLDRAS